MTTGRLEHANISVTDPERCAALLRDLLGWDERWRGPSQKYGRSVHVGGRHDYIALYTGEHVRGGYAKGQPLNHLAFTVDDLALRPQHGAQTTRHNRRASHAER